MRPYYNIVAEQVTYYYYYYNITASGNFLIVLPFIISPKLLVYIIYTIHIYIMYYRHSVSPKYFQRKYNFKKKL